MRVKWSGVLAVVAAEVSLLQLRTPRHLRELFYIPNLPQPRLEFANDRDPCEDASDCFFPIAEGSQIGQSTLLVHNSGGAAGGEADAVADGKGGTPSLPVLGATWYINLDTQTDRRAAMEEAYANAGMNSTRFPAVAPTQQSLRPNGDWNFLYERWGGEKQQLDDPILASSLRAKIGCLASHYSLMKEITEKGRPGEVYLITEDDWAPALDFMERLPSVLEYLPQDWDTVRLDCWGSKLRLPQVKDHLFRTTCPAGMTNLFYGGTHAYLVPYEKAEKMKSLWGGDVGELRGVDRMMCRPDFNNYCLQWQLFEQIPDFISVGHIPKNEEEVKAKLVGELRTEMEKALGFKEFEKGHPCTSTRRSGKAILSIFARRQSYMESVMPLYIFHLLNRTVDEVHIWNFASDPDDRAYIDSLHDLAVQTNMELIQVIKPQNTGKAGWRVAYSHYAETLGDNDVFVKVDDDITSFWGLGKFIEYLRCTNSNDLVFPNIINNDLTLPFQLIGGMLGEAAEDCVLRSFPRTKGGELSFFMQSGPIDFLEDATGRSGTAFRTDYKCAQQLHEDYLDNVDQYESLAVYRWSDAHMTVNPVFGLNGEFARERLSAMDSGNGQGSSTHTTNMTLYTGSIVSHLPPGMPGMQAEAGDASGNTSDSGEGELLERYRSAVTFVLPDTDRWESDFSKWLA